MLLPSLLSSQLFPNPIVFPSHSFLLSSSLHSLPIPVSVFSLLILLFSLTFPFSLPMPSLLLSLPSLIPKLISSPVFRLHFVSSLLLCYILLQFPLSLLLAPLSSLIDLLMLTLSGLTWPPLPEWRVSKQRSGETKSWLSLEICPARLVCLLIYSFVCVPLSLVSLRLWCLCLTAPSFLAKHTRASTHTHRLWLRPDRALNYSLANNPARELQCAPLICLLSCPLLIHCPPSSSLFSTDLSLHSKLLFHLLLFHFAVLRCFAIAPVLSSDLWTCSHPLSLSLASFF